MTRIFRYILAATVVVVTMIASNAEACVLFQLRCHRPARPVCCTPVVRVPACKKVAPAVVIPAWDYVVAEEDWDSYGDE